MQGGGLFVPQLQDERDVCHGVWRWNFAGAGAAGQRYYFLRRYLPDYPGLYMDEAVLKGDVPMKIVIVRAPKFLAGLLKALFHV